MKFEELIVLLPCHSLEDFPVHYEADDAEAILSAWSALWHPEFVASAGAMPTWSRVDCPPETHAGRLIVVPEMCERELPAGFLERAKENGAAVIRRRRHRDQIVHAALEALHDGATTTPATNDVASTGTATDAADFLAVGYLYLQVELLTRRMRYMSNIDQAHFGDQIVAAARAHVAGDHEEARRRLQGCFDVLTQAREHFYPVDAYLIDVTLVASTTLGASLRNDIGRAVESSVPINVLVSGQDLEAMSTDEPETLSALRSAFDAKTAGILGGEFGAVDAPLADVETVLADFKRGSAAFERHLGGPPAIWGRRRYGLAPWLPQLLSRLGYAGAWHVALDEGRVPQIDQAKSRWEGSDGTAIDALGKAPLDAAKADSFLSLSVKLGESMDRDHVACVVLAHWPGQSCTWYDDLRRASRFAPVLGKFVTIESFFGDTPAPGQFVRFDADEYQSPYLKQAVIRNQPDALSRHVLHHEAAGESRAAAAFETMAAALGASPDNRGNATANANQVTQLIPKTAGGPSGVLVVNTASYTRRIGVELPREMPPPVAGGHVLHAGLDAASGAHHAVVEVPPMGYAWIGGGSQPTTPIKRVAKQPPMADDSGILRNEFIEASFSRATGAIQSFRGFQHRKNVLSTQIALRTPGARPAAGEAWRDDDENATYSVMACDGIEVTRAGPVIGEITSHGRLLDAAGKKLAGFRQTARLWRGIPVLYVEVELDVAELPRADPWNSYYACRFAWADETANFCRAVGGVRNATERARLEAPHYVDLELSEATVSLLTGGMPFHRRIGLRMLDTIFVPRGEARRTFRVGIGLDLKQPMHAALDLLSPAAAPLASAAPSAGPAGWLFHVDAKNVVATHWEPVVAEGRSVGVRVRLLETLGRPAKVRLAAFRPIVRAVELDFTGREIVELPMEDGKAVLDTAAGQWTFLEARWIT